jgi:hypothetical protein
VLLEAQLLNRTPRSDRADEHESSAMGSHS